MDLPMPGKFKHSRLVGLREGAPSKPWLRARAQLREDHEALEKVEVSPNRSHLGFFRFLGTFDCGNSPSSCQAQKGFSREAKKEVAHVDLIQLLKSGMRQPQKSSKSLMTRGALSCKSIQATERARDHVSHGGPARRPMTQPMSMHFRLEMSPCSALTTTSSETMWMIKPPWPAAMNWSMKY